MRKFIQISILLAISNIAYGQDSMCGSLEFHYGPFDYRSAGQSQKNLVERAHFTPKVETLKGGNTSMTPGGDMAYTLSAFPNHHRALMALIRYSEKQKTNKPPEMQYTTDCYFERATRFRPDDATVRSLHGIYLIRSGNPKAGSEKLEEAVELSGDNPNLYYNLGLAYFDLKDYAKSLENAHKAYAGGFPLPGLRDKLTRVGKWSPPPPKPVVADVKVADVPQDETVKTDSLAPIENKK